MRLSDLTRRWRRPAAQAMPPGPKDDATITARPPQCDWAWRPAPWSEALEQPAQTDLSGGHAVTDGVTLFHDCPLSRIALRQTATEGASAPFDLTLDVGAFEGSFLSLSLDFPADAARTLRSGHIVAVTLHRGAAAREPRMFARLNVRHGPNVEQLVSDLAPGPAATLAEFDLGMHEINPAKLDHAWIDLTFDDPVGTIARIADLTVTRRPRADL